MAKCCCKGCEDRVVGCHSICEQYAAYRKEMDAAKEKTRKQNQADDILYGFNKQKKYGMNANYRK